MPVVNILYREFLEYLAEPAYGWLMEEIELFNIDIDPYTAIKKIFDKHVKDSNIRIQYKMQVIEGVNTLLWWRVVDENNAPVGALYHTFEYKKNIDRSFNMWWDAITA
jgi:hypothetical protein